MIAFDANVSLGRLAGWRGKHFEAAEDLLKAMDDCGIARALVHSSLARQSDFARGNQLLLEKIRGHDRLEPCWVAIPNRDEPQKLMAEMDRFSVRALRLFPQSGHFSIRPACMGKLAEALSRSGRVLFIDFEGTGWTDDRIDWEGIHALCSAYPELKVVVCGVTMAGPTNYRGFLADCENLHLEISQLMTPGEIGRLADQKLARRLIFGTSLPVRHPGAPLSMVESSTLEEGDARSILHDNLARLLGMAPSDGGFSGPRPTRWPGIVDSHVHLGGWNNSAADTGAAADTVREMDRCGIASAIVTSLWSCYGEVRLGNAEVKRACQEFPGRLYGYLTLDPHYPEEVREQIELYDGDPHFRGIKLHEDTQGFRVEEPLCADIFQYADRRGIPLLLHSRPEAPIWQKLCPAYPKAKFILAHLGGFGPGHADALRFAELAGTLENLYFDLASTRNYFGFLEQLAALAGSEKILYGSDHPLMDFGYELGQVFFCQLSDAEKRRVLGGNAQRLFGL